MKDVDDNDRCAHLAQGQVDLRTISTIGTHELDGGTLRLFLTAQLEAKQMRLRIW